MAGGQGPLRRRVAGCLRLPCNLLESINFGFCDTLGDFIPKGRPERQIFDLGSARPLDVESPPNLALLLLHAAICKMSQEALSQALQKSFFSIDSDSS